MNTLLLHVCIFAAVYLITAIAVFARMAYLVAHYKIHEHTDHWFRATVVDSLLWPYYVIRYGVESFVNEIK